MKAVVWHGNGDRVVIPFQIACVRTWLGDIMAPQAYENFQHKKEGTVNVVLKP